MNLVYGVIVKLSNDPEGRMARVRFGNVMRWVAVELISELRPGDRVLVCDNVAIAKADLRTTNHEDHLSRNPG